MCQPLGVTPLLTLGTEPFPFTDPVNGTSPFPCEIPFHENFSALNPGNILSLGFNPGNENPDFSRIFVAIDHNFSIIAKIAQSLA